MTETPKNGLSPSFNLAESIDSVMPTEDDVLPDAVAAAKRAMQKHEEEKDRLVYQATHDKLTDLLDRNGFEEKLEQLMKKSSSVGILYLDLDGFKSINDTKGHAAGDEVLKRVGQILRGSDITGRLGGDEFAIAVDLEVKDNERRGHNVLSPEERLAAVQEKVRNSIEKDEEIKQTGVGVSIGSVIAAPGTHLDQLLDEADQAMYEEKRQRKSSGSV